MHRLILAALALLWSTAPVPGATNVPPTAPRWQPQNTRLVVISLAGFQGEKPGQTSFSTSDRLDDPLVEMFRQRGVPSANILYLKDSQATKAEVTQQFPAFLARSSPHETLIFYYSSHGGYDPKTGAHTFTTFDGAMPIGWFMGKIEREFRGPHALLFSDCCYSGGLVDLADARPAGRTAVGALSTTGSHNLGYSGWRFTDVLLRAWSGDRAMDADGSGTIDFLELCTFAERYMAFVAEGKPLYATTGGFSPDLVLSSVKLPVKEGVGALIEARDGGKWYKAEIVDTETDSQGNRRRARVHFTDKTRYTKYAWLTESELREYQYPTYAKGERVEIRTSTGQWLPGRVLASFEAMHECRFDGKSPLYDEWMAPSRIRRPAQ